MWSQLLRWPGLGYYNYYCVAHNNMKKWSLLTNSGSLTNSSINRSPFAYEQNVDKNEWAKPLTVQDVAIDGFIVYHLS